MISQWLIRKTACLDRSQVERPWSLASLSPVQQQKMESEGDYGCCCGGIARERKWETRCLGGKMTSSSGSGSNWKAFVNRMRKGRLRT